MSIVTLSAPLGHCFTKTPMCGGYPGSMTTPMPNEIPRQVSCSTLSQQQRYRRQEGWNPTQQLQDVMPMAGLRSVKLPRQVSVPYSSSSQSAMRPSPQQEHRCSTAGPCPFGTPRSDSLEFDDLYYEGTFFDPCQPPLKAQLLQKMRMQPNALVETMRGGIGSCNAGMWIVRDNNHCLVLKLVRVGAMGQLQPAESDKFAKLCRENPGIVKDPSLSFPCKIFHCLSKGGIKNHDLIVMRQVSGVRMSEFIMQKLHGKQVPDLMRVLERFGTFLADFHARYNGMQHGDLTPANVFYDQLSGRFSLVDVADLAPRNPVIQSDTDRFSSSLKLLSHFYGPDLYMQGKTQFEAGYNARRPGMPRRAA